MFRLISMEPSSGRVYKNVYYTINTVLLSTRSRITFLEIYYGLKLSVIQIYNR
jgi:hypothetical protein